VPEEREDQKLLDYRRGQHLRPQRTPGKNLLYTFSLVLALVVALLCMIAIAAMLQDNHPGFVVVLLLCPAVGTLLAIRYARGRGAIAGAIMLIAVATFLLMAGLCSQVEVNLR
jgi:hypothetical protein